MKTIFIVLLCVSCIRPQIQDTSKSPLPHIALSIVFPIISSIAEYRNYRWGLYGNRQTDSQAWHDWQLAERIAGISVGVTIALHSDFDIIQMLKDLLLSGAMFWNIYDASLNIQKNKPFFHSSATSGSRMEGISFLKIPTFIIALLIYIN